MTIVAGFSWSRQGGAPLNLAAQISRVHRRQGHRRGDRGTAVAGQRRPRRGRVPALCHVAGCAFTRQSGQPAAGGSRHPDCRPPINLNSNGFDRTRAAHDATFVVVGSSSSGLLGRVALGSVTERLVHTAAVPVAIAPRGYAECIGIRCTGSPPPTAAKPTSTVSSPRPPSWPRSGRCDCGSCRSRSGRCRCSAARSRRPPRTLSSNSGRAGRSTISSSSSTLFAHTSRFPT